MAANIEIKANSGKLLDATRELIQQRLESFVADHRRTKELNLLLEDSNPNKPIVELTAVIGTETIVGKASAGNTMQAVEAAIGQIKSQQAQLKEQRGADSVSVSDAGGPSVSKIVGGVAGVLVLGLIAVMVSRMGPATSGDVSGIVTYNGEPLQQGMIVFHPKSGRPAQGKIVDGQIQNVFTLKPDDGAPLGEVKIAIQAFKPDPDDPTGMGAISVIPKKYADSATSGFATVIEPGTNNLALEMVD